MSYYSKVVVILAPKTPVSYFSDWHVLFQQLLLCIQASEFYALQLDESTDVAGLAQLLVYVCYVYGLSIKEDILFCKPLETRTTGDNIF